MRPVTVTFLEMHEPKELPASSSRHSFRIITQTRFQLMNTGNFITALEKNIFGWTEW